MKLNVRMDLILLSYTRIRVKKKKKRVGFRYLLLYLYLYYGVYKLIQNLFQYKADNFKQAVVIIKHFIDFLKYLTRIH